MAQINLGGSIGVPGSQSVLGNVTINMVTSDYTMSSLEFSNKFIKVNGAIGANRNLVAPLNAGQEYTVWNNTTGGFSVKIVGATGTGVTIAPGNFISVVCDGANYQQTSSSGGGGGFTANGDLAGTPTNQEVVGIFLHPLPFLTGVTAGNGYLNWTGSTWSYDNPSGAVTLGGDVTGSATANTVQKIQHISISNAAILDGYVLTATGPSDAAFQPGLIFATDLAGNLTTQSVVGIQNVPVSNLTPTTGQVLQYNTTISGKWAPASYPSLAGDVTGSFGSNTISNLQGHTVLAPSPGDGYVLTYNSAFSRWAPAPSSGVFVAANDLSGTSTFQTVVSAQNDAIAFGTSSGITFSSGYFFPVISQTPVSTSGATGKTMSVAAQSATDTGTGTTGGSLTLTSGSGDTDGYVFIETGGVTKIEVTPTITSISTTNVQLSAFTTGIPQFGSSGFITSYPVVMTGTPTTGQVLTATASVILGVTVLDWQTPASTTITWANDLAGSTNTDQWVAAISGNAGGGGTIPFNATTLSWGTAQTTAEITQSQAGSIAGSGANGITFTLQAQAGQASSGATGGAGGNLSLLAGNSGAPGTGNGNAGSITIQAGTSGAGTGNGGNITLQAGAAGSGTQGSVTIIDGSSTQEIITSPTDIQLKASGTVIIDVQSDRTTFQGAIYNQVTTVTSSPYTVDLGGPVADYFVNCNVAGVLAIQIRGAAYLGRTLVFTDTSGAASGNNITITPSSPLANISGSANYVINTNYGSVTLMSDGSNWFVIAKV